MGMPIDDIVAKVGWLSSNTFVTRYMKPLAKFKHCMVPINQSDVGNSDRLIDKLVTTKDSNITDQFESKPKKPRKTRKTKKKVLENVNLATTGSTNQQAVVSENLTDSLTINSTDVCSDNSCSDNRTATTSPSMNKKSSKTVQLWKEKFMWLWGNDPRFKLPKNSKSNNRKDSFLSRNAEKSKTKPGKKKVQRKCKVSHVRSADKNKGSSDICDNDHTDYSTSINDEMKTLDTIMTPEFMNTVLATDGPINTDNELMDFDVFNCMSESDLLQPPIADDNATDDIDNNKSLTASCSSDTDMIDMNDIPITQVPMPELNKGYSIQTLRKQPNMSKTKNSKLTRKKHTTTQKKRLPDRSLKFVNYFTLTSPLPTDTPKSVHHIHKVPQLHVSTSISAPPPKPQDKDVDEQVAPLSLEATTGKQMNSLAAKDCSLTPSNPSSLQINTPLDSSSSLNTFKSTNNPQPIQLQMVHHSYQKGNVMFLISDVPK